MKISEIGNRQKSKDRCLPSKGFWFSVSVDKCVVRKGDQCNDMNANYVCVVTAPIYDTQVSIKFNHLNIKLFKENLLTLIPIFRIDKQSAYGFVKRFFREIL
jgi:hypothetical protein